MVFCQLQDRAKLGMDQPLQLGDVTRSTLPEKLTRLELPCPNKAGVWKLTALDCAAALQKALPQETITMLGADVCYVHRVHIRQHDRTKWLRTAAAFLILLMGSALGLSWFHSDVDMPTAQLLVYRILTGRELENPLLVTIPYCIGVALGVGVFYALPAMKTTTPLEVKLTQYQEDLEKTEGKDMGDA